jgi:hypothetical protein
MEIKLKGVAEMPPPLHFVVPAKAGTYSNRKMEVGLYSGLRQNDEMVYIISIEFIVLAYFMKCR